MRLVIDMQGAQSIGNRHRGIGRYTVSIAKELVAQAKGHEVVLALNGAFPETVEALRAEFANLLPPDAICVWWPPRPCYGIETVNDQRRIAAEASMEAFITSLQPDVVLISSLFEGLVDDAAVSIGRLGRSAPTAAILYDLIPLIHADTYLQNPDMMRWYQQRLDHLRRADLLLAISKSSAQEAVDHLDFAEDSITAIGTACGSEFKPIPINQAARDHLLSSYRIRDGFILYTGGIDHRKNIEKLIESYSMLPEPIKKKHQLVVVCSVHEADRARLERLASDLGFGDDQFVLTGYVPDSDLVTIYNACELFVFPSWHEGFGLPALEAMSCGRATIGSNTSSLPEVLGLNEAQFDPYDAKAISRTMAKALTDEAFNARLRSHAIAQAKKFSWPLTAKAAWAALTRLFARAEAAAAQAIKANLPTNRPKLAMVTPVRAAKSGIADYVSELLPQLSRFYEIELVVDQLEDVTDRWAIANATLRSVEWFRENYLKFDRVVYHFGNSHYHAHMFDLLKDVPGVVVLHDFFLSGIVAHMDVTGLAPGCWPKALLADHGWHAAKARFEAEDTANVVWAYPCNGDVLRYARGMIIHSQHSVDLARKWYSVGAAPDWTMIPHLRVPVVFPSQEARAKARAEARRQLNIVADDFVVCSFGHLGQTKLNHKLLEAWKLAGFARDPRSQLVFAGQNEGGTYGQHMDRQIQLVDRQVRITGFLDTDEYRRWLLAADVAVQLRTNSRGETSGAVLDCWNYGVATIVNAHGGLADLPPETVLKIPDEFGEGELAEALSLLMADSNLRNQIGASGRNQILSNQNPRECAARYQQAIEKKYVLPGSPVEYLQTFLLTSDAFSHQNAAEVVRSISMSFPPKLRRTQWLVDVSELVKVDSKSGIQRVVRALLRKLLTNPPPGVSVRPVYASTDEVGYRYADCFTARFLEIEDGWCEDRPIEAWAGDLFFALDLQPEVLPRQIDQIQQLMAAGVRALAVVYDLLPIHLPDTFIEGAAAGHSKWLDAVQRLDGAMCISRAVADELFDWLQEHGDRSRKVEFEIHHFPLGADIDETAPTRGRPSNADELLTKLSAAPTFLAVGTIEPRKSHELVLDAFENLWSKDLDYLFVIVGKQGWMVENLVDRIRDHPEFDRRLIWLDGVSDEFLDELYRASDYLIAASRGEGFGLPLIEAAQRETPVIARDIPVFREVAGDWATFFSTHASERELADVIAEMAKRPAEISRKSIKLMPKFTWQSCSDAITEILSGQQKPYSIWPNSRNQERETERRKAGRKQRRTSDA